eukprot:gene10875-12691_t
MVMFAPMFEWTLLGSKVSTNHRGAHLDNCNLACCNSSATDARGELREALWRATEEQIAAALAKGNI